jgi:dUTP pyrophosphatase
MPKDPMQENPSQEDAFHEDVIHSVPVAVRRVGHGVDLPLPEYQSAQAAGLDLLAALAPHEKITLNSGQRALVPAGLSLQLSRGFEAQVRPRSGLALKHGVTVLNTPGTVDSDYRGEVSVLLINLGHEPFEITRGLRIAQLVVAPVSRVRWEEAEQLDETGRGRGGFGSTGLHRRKNDTQ